MRILFYSSYFYPYISGLTVYPLNVLKELSKDQDIDVLTFPHAENLSKDETYEGIKIHRMPYVFRLSKGFISPQSLYYFWKYAREADMVILNLPNAEAWPLAVTAHALGKRIISIYHCQVDLGPEIAQRAVVAALDAAVRIQLASSAVVVTNEDYISQFPSLYESVKEKIVFLYPYIPKRSTTEKSLKKFATEKSNDVWIGFAGRFAREKGVEHLIEAVKKLDMKNVQIVFAGPSGHEVAGEHDYFTYITHMMAEAGIAYKFFGTLTDDELTAFYQTIDVLAFPSVNSTESFGIVQIEAMESGTPVVGSSLPGVRVAIKETGMGISVDPEDHEEFAKALSEVLKNRAKYTSREKIKKTSDLFSSEKTVALYKALIAKTRTS